MTTASGNNAVIEIVTKGPKGDAGVGIPAGGTVGQTLVKASGDDYDSQWSDAGTGTVSSVDLDAPTGFAVAGGPITTSGTITLSYAAGYQGFTTAESSKLAGIAAGAEVNVNADWDATTGDAEILNKPTLGTAAALDVGTTTGTVAAGDDARFHDAVTLATSVADVLGLTGQELTADDPGGDRLLFWDDSASKLTHLTLGDNLSITGTTLAASGAGSTPGGTDGTIQYNDGGVLEGNSDFTVDPDWNDAATVFTGLKLNVTDTASAAGSKLLDLQANGTNRFYMSSTGIGYLPTAGGDASAFIFGGTSIANASGYTGIYGFRLRSTNSLTWSSDKNLNVLDTGLARDSAGVVKITDGSAGTGYLRQVPITVASLPTAAAGNAGTRIFVSDASVAAAGNFGSVVAGGGSNTVPVYSDGGAWRIG